jgi:3-hydroxyacyl-CoA dehydrogenase
MSRSCFSQAGRSFYRENGAPTFVGFDGRSVIVPETEGTLSLARVRRATAVIEETADTSMLDLGDGVALLGFRSKMGTLGAGVMRGLHSALERVEKEGRVGLVIGHEDPRAFSAGANLVATLEAAKAKRWKETEDGIREFQDSIMAIRRAPFPVVSAPFGLTLGGGAEIVLHSDRVQAHAELYVGLVETGVGLLPAGGGTKELLFRFTEELAPYEDANPFDAIRRAFGLIAMAKTSGSALEAEGMGFLRRGDRITMNRDRLIADAKARVLDLAPDYIAPVRGQITALGRKAFGNLQYGIGALHEAGQITDHEVTIATEVAYILCAGDGNPRQVSEQDILDFEREGFLKLLGTEKTQERIAYTLKTGKPLRN